MSGNYNRTNGRYNSLPFWHWIGLGFLSVGLFSAELGVYSYKIRGYHPLQWYEGISTQGRECLVYEFMMVFGAKKSANSQQCTIINSNYN